MPPDPNSLRLLLIGGGHAHVEVLRQFGNRAPSGCVASLVSRDVMTPYSGMLPGLIAGHYTETEICIDLEPLCRRAGIELIHDIVRELDVAAGIATCASGRVLEFDLLSVKAAINGLGIVHLPSFLVDD